MASSEVNLRLADATLAQRWAARMYKKGRSRAWPVLPILYIVQSDARALMEHNATILGLDVAVLLVMLTLMTVERQGFCGLIDEYERELRLVRRHAGD